MQFAWNVKACFLGKIKMGLLKFVPTMLGFIFCLFISFAVARLINLHPILNEKEGMLTSL